MGGQIRNGIAHHAVVHKMKRKRRGQIKNGIAHQAPAHKMKIKRLLLQNLSNFYTCVIIFLTRKWKHPHGK